MKTENFHQAGCLLALTLAVSLAGLQAAVAEDADGVRVTDYFISHTSNEPFYAEQKLDPSVTLHVREVVLPGRERTVAQDGKVLLLIHGYSVPGYIAFDTDQGNCSLMRHFARAGWDTFALDLEGFGLSTRPPVMDDPTVFPDSKAPIHADVTLRDVERVVDFISALRGVEQVHLLGWSQGATVEAPLYAIRHPEKVARLVLFAPSYDNSMTPEEREKSAADGEAEKVFQQRSLAGALGGTRHPGGVRRTGLLRSPSGRYSGVRPEVGRTRRRHPDSCGAQRRPGSGRPLF